MTRSILILFSTLLLQGIALANGYEESPRRFSLDASFGWNRYRDYRADPAQTTETTGGACIHGEFGYMPYRGYGAIVIGAAVSTYWMRNTTPSGSPYSLLIMHAGGTLTYRFDFIPHQFIVPFVKAGVGVGWSQQLEANALSAFGGIGYSYGFGGSMLLNTFDRKSGQTLDSVFGINATYLQVEYVSFNMSSGNLSHTAIRAGVRFEF